MSSIAVPTPRAERAEISRQTGALYVAQLVGMALNFGGSFLLARWLGEDNFGVFTFCAVSVLAFVGLFFEFGTFIAGSRRLALAHRTDQEREILGALGVIGLLLGGAMAVFIGGIAPLIDRTFHSRVAPILWACLPLVVAFPLQYLLELACQGANRIGALVLLRLGIPGLSLAGVVLARTFADLTPLTALLASQTGTALACGLVLFVLRPSFRNLGAHLAEIIEETKSFGADVYAGRITVMLSQRLDSQLIPFFLGATSFGLYNLGQRLADPLINFSRSLAVTRFRSFAQSKEIPRALLWWNFLLLLVGGIALVLFMPFLLRWFLPKYVGIIPLLVPFTVASVFGGMYQQYNTFLAAHGKGGELRNISLSISIAYIAALGTTIPFGGLTGAAWVVAGVAGLNFLMHRYYYLQALTDKTATGEKTVALLVVNLSGDRAGAEAWAAGYAPSVTFRLLDKGDVRGGSKLNAIRRLRATPCDVFAVYCDRLEWQTLRTPMLLFGLLVGARTCVIADAHGKLLHRSVASLVIWEIPHLAIEVFGGIAMIGVSWGVTKLLGVGGWGMGDGKKEEGNKNSRLGNEERAATADTGFGDGRKTTVNHIANPQPPTPNLYPPTPIPQPPPSLLFIRTTPTSGSQTGGATSHISGFIQGATALGARVRFLSNDAISGVDPEVVPVTIVTPSGFFTAHRMLFELWNNLVFTVRALREVGAHRYDFLYQRYSRFNWTGVVLARKTGLPLVLEYNGSEVWIGRYWDSVQMLWLLEAFELLNLHAAAAIFVVSEVERDNLLARNIPGEKIFVNPNGVNPEAFRPGCGGAAVREMLGVSDRIVVGFVGTFGPWHGVEVMARAALRLPDDAPFHFLMIGEGVTKAKVETLFAEAGRSDRVTFAGRVSHSRVAAYLDACDILVSPQVQPEDGGEFFGSPTKLFEYMAMEKAIVASRVGQIGRILDDGVTALLTPPGDAEALAEAFSRLAADPELRARLGAAARRVATERFTWKDNARRVLDVAREL